MDLNNLSREEAVKLVGEFEVTTVESENCDFTNSTRQDSLIEFSASTVVRYDDLDKDKIYNLPVGNSYTLLAYYYQCADDVNRVENLDELDWDIDHFTIV